MFKFSYKWFACAFCIIVLYILLLPLQYGTFKFRTVLNPTVWIIVGVVITNLMINKNNKHIFVKLIISFSIYIILTCLFVFRMIVCRSGDDRILYAHKIDNSLTIVCSSFDCYLTSGPCILYKKRKLLGELTWSTKISEDVIDTTNWERVVR